MKKWMKNLILSVLLVTAFSTITASAKNIAIAVLEKAEDSNDVSVAIELPKNRAETVTSLRFKLLVAVEEARLAAFDEESVSFEFSDVPCEVKDAEVVYDPEVTDYVVDIVLSGKSPLFQNGDGTELGIGTLRLPSGDYYAEVGCVVTENDQDSASELQYVDSAGLEMAASLKSSETIFIGKKTQPDSETEETDPMPQSPETPQEPQATPGLTEPIPSGPSTGAATPSETVPTPKPKPALQPAEPRRNGLSAPEFTVKPVTGTKQLSFAWEKVEGAQGYQIFRYDEESGEYEKYKNVRKTSFTAKFSYGMTCRFKVRAYKKKNGSKLYGAFSAEKEVTVSSFNKKKKLSFHAEIPAKGKKLRFTWQKMQGADGYQILRYEAQKKGYKVVKTVVGGDKVKARAVKYQRAADYRFRMRAFAYDADGNKVYGAESAEIRITTPPEQVSGFEADSLEEFTIKLTWEAVAGADGYYIYRSEPDEENTIRKIAKVGSGVRSYTDENLDGGARYYYQVSAFRRGLDGKRKNGERSVVKSAEVK